MNLVSVSSASIAQLDNNKYYVLENSVKIMKRLFKESVVDSFELQLYQNETAKIHH